MAKDKLKKIGSKIGKAWKYLGETQLAKEMGVASKPKAKPIKRKKKHVSKPRTQSGATIINIYNTPMKSKTASKPKIKYKPKSKPKKKNDDIFGGFGF